MNDKSLEQLEAELDETRAERNKFHAMLTDFRLKTIEEKSLDHENRLRPLENMAIKFNTIYALFAGNGLMSLIILVKLFSEAP